MGEERIHDLDQLFGTHKAIKVKWQGELFELPHPDSFDPVQTNRIQKLKSKMTAGYSKFASADEVPDEVAEEIGRVTEEMLEILNSELNRLVSFWQRVRIITFYGEQVQAELSEEEKKRVSSLTGEISTPD